MTIPAHLELDTGTCRAILRQASRFVPEEQLRPFFYSDQPRTLNLELPAEAWRLPPSLA